MVIGAGTYNGSIRKSTGAATMASPKPIELCINEPMNMTITAIAISISGGRQGQIDIERTEGKKRVSMVGASETNRLLFIEAPPLEQVCIPAFVDYFLKTYLH